MTEPENKSTDALETGGEASESGNAGSNSHAAPTSSLPPPEPTLHAVIPADTITTAPAQRDAPIDPRVAALRALFPDFDDGLLLSVLESVGGNQDRAVDVLLGMSDPEYKSEAPAVQPMTQSELDEQLAHRLYLEDQQAAAWHAQQYNQRLEGQVPTGLASPPGQEKDTMAELGEQFNKFAETGKKAIGNLFTKVKAKINEFDQSRQGSTSQSTWGGVGGDTYPYEPGQNPYPAPGHQPSYFGPTESATTHPAEAAASPGPPRPYDTTPSPKIEQPTSEPPHSTSGSPPIDSGKIGLLPKRPVSLLQSQSPPKDNPSAAPASKASPDDELEYVENPFEEGKK